MTIGANIILQQIKVLQKQKTQSQGSYITEKIPVQLRVVGDVVIDLYYITPNVSKVTMLYCRYLQVHMTSTYSHLCYHYMILDHFTIFITFYHFLRN